MGVQQISSSMGSIDIFMSLYHIYRHFYQPRQYLHPYTPLTHRTEAFHHIFTRTLPILVINLILTGAQPQFLRRQIIHGGPALDNMFQMSMLDLLYTELGLRLNGTRPPEQSKAISSDASRLPLPIPIPTAAPTPSVPPRDGVCFHTTSYDHAVPIEEDDHGACLCQLTSCLQCYQMSAIHRKGPVSLLPYELRDTMVSEGWSGEVENEAQARIRSSGLAIVVPQLQPIPAGKGFVQNPKPPSTAYRSGPPLFPHPQMTDVLAVEEHIRWRLKEMGANDPAVEGRYGPCTNAPAALEGIELRLPGSEEDEEEDNGSVKSGGDASGNGNGAGGKKKSLPPKVTKGRGKMRRAVNGAGTMPKKGSSGKDDKSGNALNGVNGNGTVNGSGKTVCYLPKEWAEAEPGVRNMAVTLTFRHFVKVSALGRVCSAITCCM